MGERKKWSSMRLAIAAWILPPVLWGVMFLVAITVAFLTKAHITVSGPGVYSILVLLFIGLQLVALARGLAAFNTAPGKVGVAISAASLILVLVLVPMYFTRVSV